MVPYQMARPKIHAVLAPSPFRMAQAAPLLPSAPPAMPDFLLTGYTGVTGFLEGILVLAVTGAAAWVGIRTGLDKKAGKVLRAAGWVGGGGSALLGALYLAGKTGLSGGTGIPAVRVSPS